MPELSEQELEDQEALRAEIRRLERRLAVAKTRLRESYRDGGRMG